MARTRELRLPALRLALPAELGPSLAMSGIVPVEKVKILIRNPNARASLDTLVRFGNSDSLAVPLRVGLDIWWPDEAEPFALSLAFVNAAGDTVFRGGPVTLRLSAGRNDHAAQVTVPVAYTGLGSNAAGIRISPKSLFVVSGDAFALSAVATGPGGQPIGGAPVAWRSLDAGLVVIPNAAVGNGTAIGTQGTARVVGQLLTGPADTVTLVIQPRPPILALVSGGGQSGEPGRPLPGPVIVRVTASDGTGRAGVAVTFSPLDGGTATPAAALTDADGVARSSWTLGSGAGTHEMRVSAPGATGSPLVVAATAAPAAPDSEPPAPKPGADTAAAPPPGSPAVAARRLAFTARPVDGVVGAMMPPVVVSALDDSGRVAAAAVGTVTLSLLGAPTAALEGTRTAAFASGVATFSGLSVNQMGTGLRLVATSGSLRPDTSAAFAMVAGAAARIAIAGGDGQSATVSTALATPLTARVTDAFGNPVALATVTFAVQTGGGSLSVASAQTGATGLASTTWTLGPTAGFQTVTATAPGLAGSPLTWSATATAAASVAHLEFVQPPTDGVAGAKLTPSVVVHAVRPDGSHDPTYRGDVTLSLSINPGGATLAGGRAGTNAGSATFNDVTIDRAGSGYQIVASAPGLQSATSGLFNVAPATATFIAAFAGDGQEGIVGTTLVSPLAVLVTDGLGNPVSGIAAQWVVANGGTLSASTSTTSALGVAQVTWTLGPSPGQQSVVATATGLPGSVTFRAQAKKK